MLELSAGQIVADKYRIDGVMGTGGMGVIVAATHVELDQRVAIKFLREVSPEALARFQREARLLVRLKSPHVAKVFDVGSLEDDTPYIVMEHLDGSDLSTVLGARGRLPHEEAIDYVLQASEAVAEAHALGMVHRDLKPANIFLAKGPGTTTTVKVLDFGVSKILDDRVDAGDQTRGGDLTNEGVALGSPGYMSPEQMTSARNVDARSDIFSLGALLYRLIAGHTPFKGNSIVTLLAAMATEKVVPLHRIAPDVPEGVSLAVERCLAQERDQRWQNVALFAHALLPFASRRGRVMIEQISSTLGVPIPEDVLSATIQRPVTAPPSGFPLARATHPSHPPAVGVVPETLVMGPSAGAALRSSAPPPASLTSTSSTSSRTLALSAFLLALGLAMGIAGWLVARSRPADPEPVTSAATATSAVAPPATTTLQAPPPPPAATTQVAPPPPPPEPTTEPPPPKAPGKPTPVVKPRATSSPARR
ncbi:MAG: serine/threonine protein kinase [Deltaproteobacteria bacterium]|nr:serine/threonine protein kinase [Deltaproteobacteria bacterium]